MRRFGVKLFWLLLLLLAGQLGVGYFYPAELAEPVLRFQALLDQRADIIYLGDSTLWHPTGSQTTAAMLQELLPTRTVGELSHAAYGMEIYQSYLAFMLRQDYRPALVIVPINLRSFSPEWDQRPGYQFTREKRVLALGLPLARALGRPLQLFGGYTPPITTDEFLRNPVYAGTTKIGIVQDFEGAVGGAPLTAGGGEPFVYYQEIKPDTDYRRLLTYYYMAALSPNHRKVRAMVEIARRLQQAGVPVLFYITPVNVELGDVHVGAEFRQQFADNVAVVKAQLAAQGVDLLDLSFDLAAYFFADTEHLRQPGKHYVAQQLAAHIDPATRAPTSTPSPLPLMRATDAVTTPTAPPIVTPTPIANPLLATAVMRATLAAER